MLDEQPMTEAQISAIVAELGQAGLVEVTTDEQGRDARTLTAEGERLGNMLAMVADEDQRLAVISDLLDEAKE